MQFLARLVWAMLGATAITTKKLERGLSLVVLGVRLSLCALQSPQGGDAASGRGTEAGQTIELGRAIHVLHAWPCHAEADLPPTV